VVGITKTGTFWIYSNCSIFGLEQRLIMPKYKDKECCICGKTFNPISPNQKYCLECRDEGCKIRSRERDRNRYRKKYNYKKYVRYCIICGKRFTTYYSKKLYCGSSECEKERIRIKNAKSQKTRDKLVEKARSKEYYNRNKDICKLKKAMKYRELHQCTKDYVPGRVYKYTIEEVRSYVSEFGYTLLSTEYKNNNSKIRLLCPEGHEWETTFHNFKGNGDKKGNRCLYCYLENNYTSIPEQKLVDYFIDNYPNIKLIHNDRKQIAPFEIDLYFPNNKLGIEVCGLYWHSEISGGKSRKYHYDKMMKCYKNGIRLITVFEDEIRDKFMIVISRILHALNIADLKVCAEECEVKEIDNISANEFFVNNHIHGSSQFIKSWGLFYSGELLQVCSVDNVCGKCIYNIATIELKRFCSKFNVIVVGGFSKLFKYVINYCIYNGYKFIKLYCDMRYDNIFNTIYEKAGFSLESFVKYTPHYIKNGSRYYNFPSVRIDNKELAFGYEHGYDCIWDCGYRIYVYKVG